MRSFQGDGKLEELHTRYNLMVFQPPKKPEVQHLIKGTEFKCDHLIQINDDEITCKVWDAHTQRPSAYSLAWKLTTFKPSPQNSSKDDIKTHTFLDQDKKLHNSRHTTFLPNIIEILPSTWETWHKKSVSKKLIWRDNHKKKKAWDVILASTMPSQLDLNSYQILTRQVTTKIRNWVLSSLHRTPLLDQTYRLPTIFHHKNLKGDRSIQECVYGWMERMKLGWPLYPSSLRNDMYNNFAANSSDKWN